MKSILFSALIMSLLIASCSKSTNSGGMSANWGGNYDVAGTNDTVNRVAVSVVNSNTVNMAIAVSANGGMTFYSPVTITNVMLSTDSTASYNTYDVINSSPYAFHVVGTAKLAGSTITLIASYTDTMTNVTLPYQFRGTK